MKTEARPWKGGASRQFKMPWHSLQMTGKATEGLEQRGGMRLLVIDDGRKEGKVAGRVPGTGQLQDSQ